jgi:hypothetical protein
MRRDGNRSMDMQGPTKVEVQNNFITRDTLVLSFKANFLPLTSGLTRRLLLLL